MTNILSNCISEEFVEYTVDECVIYSIFESSGMVSFVSEYIVVVLVKPVDEVILLDGVVSI